MFIDTHSHFDICMENPELSEDFLINSMVENKIENAVQVAVDRKNIEWSYDFSKKYENIYLALGIHPSSDCLEGDLDFIENFISKNKNERLLGIGETGLDYHWMHYEKQKQMDIFERQIDIAKKNDLYVIVHSREAMEDTKYVLKSSKAPKVILHCFSGDLNDAKYFVDQGYLISFAGNLTFKKAVNLHEALKVIPLENLLFETDCPYLAPVPMRGKKNRPDFVKHTYEFAAQMRGIEVEKLAHEVKNNFNRLISNS